MAADVLKAAEDAYARGRRDTPTGTVIARLDPQTDRERWLSVRRTGIGSSDMAALLGMSKYRSELDVYVDKRGEVPLDSDEAGEAARWGNLLEDIVAREWASRHHVSVRRIGTVANVTRRHMLCDLDRLVMGCRDHERCALEVKTRSAFKAEEWKGGATPEDVEAQTMQQLAVTGLEAIHVAGLVGGQRLESRLVLPEADYIADLHTVADEFWADHVLTGAPPSISSLDLLEQHLKRLTPDKGVVAELTDVQQRDVKHLTRLIVEGERAEAAGKEAKQRLQAIIGEDATDVLLPADEGPPVPWWTWRSQALAKRVDLAAVAEALGLEGEDDVKAKFAVSGGTTRVLRKGKGAKALAVADDE